MIEYRTTKRVREQYTAFMEGFNELIPQELINTFDGCEVELLIGGISESMSPPRRSFLLPGQLIHSSLQLMSMIGPNSPPIADTLWMTKSSSGSGNASAPGPLNADHACFTLLPARVGSPLAASITCEGLSVRTSLPLRKVET